MAWVFSQQSLRHLQTADTRLIEVAMMALTCSPVDLGISCGHRGQDEQTQVYLAGRSKVTWPNSKHNASPSLAIDFFPVLNGSAQWERPDLFHLIAGIMIGIADCLGYRLRWGGAWDGRVNGTDEWSDLPHIEIKKEKANGLAE